MQQLNNIANLDSLKFCYSAG